MYTATVSSNYRVVIPRAIRERFGVQPGRKLAFIPYKHTLRVVVLLPIEDAYGFLEGIGTEVPRDEDDRA